MGVTSDIIDLIRHRKRIYESAYQGDIARLKTVHGSAVIDEAMRQMVEEDEQQRQAPPLPPPRLIPRRRYKLGGR
jgi:hypothetical protein